MSFSVALKLSNLDDFLTPAQDCVLPILEQPPEQEKPDLIRATGKISLADCLACSGCVTTAEARLVEESHHGILLDILRKKRQSSTDDVPIVVLSISWQSACVLAAAFNLPTVEDALQRLSGFLRKAGVDLVCGDRLARSIYRHQVHKEATQAAEKFSPRFSSQCPGVVCFAEKSSQSLLTRLSRVPSPMLWQGLLVKKLWRSERVRLRRRLSPYLCHPASSLLAKMGALRDVYHVSIQPCYDKKLEALRPEFKSYVDLVLGTNQFLDLIVDLAREAYVPAGNSPEGPGGRAPRGAAGGVPAGGVAEAGAPAGGAAEAESQERGAAEAEERDKLVEEAKGEFIWLDGKRLREELIPASCCSEGPVELDEVLLWGRRIEIFRPLGVEVLDSSGYGLSAVNGGELEGSIRGLNGDHMVYGVGGRRLEVATGFRNLQNLARRPQLTERSKVDLLGCPSGCLNGGAHAALFQSGVSSLKAAKRIHSLCYTEVRLSGDRSSELLSRVLESGGDWDCVSGSFSVEYKMVRGLEQW